MSKEVWATKFSEESIFCTCDCHGKAGLKHPQSCFFCAELHKSENYPEIQNQPNMKDKK